MRKKYPLIGLGRGTFEGAGRIGTSDNDWKEVFKKLANKAKVIFVIPAENDGTIFEVNYIINNSFLDKTIFIMPPFSNGVYNEETWNSAIHALENLGLYFPPYSIDGAMIHLKSIYGSCFVRDFFLNNKKKLREDISEFIPTLIF